MNKKSTGSTSASKKDVFVKSAVQIAILVLATGSIAQAQDASQSKPADTKAAPAPGEIQTVVVTSTGLRGSQRTMVDTPVPVDVLAASELTKTAQASLDKALGFRVPSFNTVQTPVNDATSLLDPYEIRNMGPSRALILINGKRKNASALIYTQTSPGRGESGADISAIPQDAIKRIEVLRDGASAQYGSDAIAGVVNIILKDNPNGTSMTARTGVTHKGDGKMAAFSVNHGMALGDSGFVNVTFDTSKNGLASRSGIVSARGEAATFGDGPATFEEDLKKVNAFLAKKPDAGNINGSPDTRAVKFLVNSRYDLDDGIQLYGNAAYITKKIDSYANYRTPYWRPTDYGLLTPAGKPYEGYVPGFLGALEDYNGTLGAKFEVAGWSADASVTFGGNEQMYTVTNSVNRGMENAYLDAVAKNITPLPPHGQTRFDAGGSRFSHVVFNADFSKDIAKGVNAYFGTEVRKEQYTLIAGERASWLYSGADSYAGNTPENSFTSKRDNSGMYGGALFDVSDQLVVDATGRFEKYSDFGNATIGKLSLKYKVDDTLTLRSSLSSGFRAPSLHQIYTQKTQYSFAQGSIQVSGLASNVSKEVAALGVPKLKAEKSTSITLGLGYKPNKNTSMTLDYYNISLKDRIILGKEIKPSGDATAELDKILKTSGIVSLSFFVNALDSKTSGIDYVFNHRNMKVGDGKLAFNLSGNYVLQNERTGGVNNPASIAKAGQSVLDITQEALMFTSRPKFKTIFGFDYDINDFNFSLNNTVFGPTKFRNADLDQNLQVTFKTKTVTDFSLNYQINKNMTLAFAINNMFNVTPSWKLEAVGDKAKGQAILDSKTLDYSGRTPAQVQSDAITFDQRYSMVTYDGSHFSQLGRIYNLSLNYRF